MRAQKIAPYVHISCRHQHLNTLVVSSSDNPAPRWDDTFSIFVDMDDLNNGERGNLWLRVFDFRELGKSMPLGLVCISLKNNI